MSIEVKVPQLPESVADATLVAWHKKAGDAVRREENLVDLETDKVVLEVPAPADGVIKQIVANDGAVVTSGQLLAILETGAAASAAAGAAARRQAGACGTEGRRRRRSPRRRRAAPPRGPPRRAGTGSSRAGRSTRSMRGRRPTRWDLPSASSSRSTISIPTSIAGSGREGRITKGDVLDYIADHQATTVGIEHEVLSNAGVGRQPLGADAAAAADRATSTASP